MISVYPVLYTLVLFSELSSHSVTVAMPATTAEDSAPEQDGLGLILGDEPLTEPAVVPPVHRRGHLLENSVRDEDGNPKIVIISPHILAERLKTTHSIDPGLICWLMDSEAAASADPEHGPIVSDFTDWCKSSFLDINVSKTKDMDMRLKGIRGLNPAFTRSLPLLADRSLSHTPAEHSLKIDRRNTDLDMLRCMIGRVYRPCWEVEP